MISIIGVVFLILSGLVTYFFYVKPKQEVEQFALKAQKLGYKVKRIPFHPLKYYLISYSVDEQKSLRVLKQEIPKYDIVVGNLFNKLAVTPVHTDILKDLFNQSNKIHKKQLYIECFDLFAKKTVPLSEGEQWKRKRKMISSVFHFDFVNDMIPLIHSQAEQEFKRIDQKIKNGQTINIMLSLEKILSSVIVKCFFGDDVSQYRIDGRPFEDYFMELLNEVSRYSRSIEHMLFGLTIYHLGLTKRVRQIKRKVQIVKTISRQFIQKQLLKLKNQQFKKKNLLTILQENDMINETNTPNTQKYTKDQLIAQFLSFFTAGTDSTSNTVNLALNLLSQNPQYVERIQKQLESLKEIHGPEKVKKMKFTQAIVDETLRIGGSAPSLFPRVIKQTLTAGGLQFPKQSSLNIFTIVNQYKSQHFQKPAQFIPQRWLQDRKIPPFIYLPFSTGERNCIGMHLAKVETKILISKIVERYRFKATQPLKMVFEFLYQAQSREFQMSIKTPKEV